MVRFRSRSPAEMRRLDRSRSPHTPPSPWLNRSPVRTSYQGRSSMLVTAPALSNKELGRKITVSKALGTTYTAVTYQIEGQKLVYHVFQFPGATQFQSDSKQLPTELHYPTVHPSIRISHGLKTLFGHAVHEMAKGFDKPEEQAIYNRSGHIRHLKLLFDESNHTEQMRAALKAQLDVLVDNGIVSDHSQVFLDFFRPLIETTKEHLTDTGSLSSHDSSKWSVLCCKYIISVLYCRPWRAGCLVRRCIMES